MKPVTIIYVTDMERSLDWYRRVVPGIAVVSSSPYWSELTAAGGTFALHASERVERGSQLGLAFSTDRPLEEIVAHWENAGIEPTRDITDEAFGRSAVVTDPDGLAIQVNEHAPDLYP